MKREFSLNREFTIQLPSVLNVVCSAPGQLLFRDNSVRLVHPAEIDTIELGDDDMWVSSEMFFSD